MSSLWPTRSELFSTGRQAIVGMPGTKINPAMVDVPGSDVNLAVAVPATIGHAAVVGGAVAMRGAFIDSARGPALDRVVADRYGLTRCDATPATVDLPLSRPTFAGGAGTMDAGFIVQTADGQQFGFNAAVSWGTTDLTKTVVATALAAGEAGNVAPGTLTQMATAPFDSTITVATPTGFVGNPTGATGGTETEDDIVFIARVRGYLPTLSRGILGAIEFGARQVPGVLVATATEIVNPDSGMPAAAVQLVVGDRNGLASSSMLQSVADKMLEYRALGIPVFIASGLVRNVSVTWRIGFMAGYDEDLIVSRIRAVTVAISQFLPPGPDAGTLRISALLSAARSVPGAIVSDDSLIFPLGDVVPTTAFEMLRVQPTDVTIT